MGRRRNKSGKMWRAKVARVAKNVAIRNLETKRIGFNVISNVTQSAGASTALALGQTNIMFGLTQGVGRAQRIGNQITLKGINFKFTWDSVGQANLSNTVHIRVSLFKVDPFLLTAGVANFTRDQLFIDGATVARPMANLYVRGANEDQGVIQKVYFDRVVTFNPTLSVAVSAKHFMVKVPMHNMKYKYASDSSGNGDEYDLVLVTQAWVAGSAKDDDTGTIITDYRIYYKDG